MKTTDLNNSIIIETEEKVTDVALRETSLRIYPIGTILVAMYGGFNQIGRTGLLGIGATINQALSAISLRPEMQPEFVLNWLNANVEEWKRLAGSSRKDPNINSRDVADFPIVCPPLAEQRQIAAVLGTWDRVIEQTTDLLKQLRIRHRGLMQRLLTGKVRLPGFDEIWKHLEIGEVAQEVSVRNRSDKQLTVLSCTKYDGLVDSLEYFGRKIFSDDLTTYKIVSRGEFAYATNHIEEGSIGYQSGYDAALISPMYTVFRTDATVDDHFLYFLLKTDRYIQEYKRNMVGSIDRRGGLRWNDFSKIVIPLPTVEEQCAIAQMLDTSLREIRQQEAKLDALREQKRGLMQSLLTGRVRVPGAVLTHEAI